MAKKRKNDVNSTYKCSGCVGLIAGFRKSPCIVSSEDTMTTPTQCVFKLFNGFIGDEHSRAKLNPVKGFPQQTSLVDFDLWEKTIFGSQESSDSFIERFLPKHKEPDPVMDLTSVHWNSCSMKICYVLMSGQHITTSEPMSDWLDYFKSVSKG